MSKTVDLPVTCLKCNSSQDCTVYESINVTVHPELKDDFMTLKLNQFNCKKCDNESFINRPFMYHDMKGEFLIWFTPEAEPPEEWWESTKTVGRHMGPDNYFCHPIIVHDIMEAVFMVGICDKNGSPQTDQRINEYREAARLLAIQAKEEILSRGRNSE